MDLSYLTCIKKGKTYHPTRDYFMPLLMDLSSLTHIQKGKMYHPTRDCFVSLSTELSSMTHLHQGRMHTVYTCPVCNDILLSQQSLANHQLQQLKSGLQDHNYYLQTQLNLSSREKFYMKQESELDSCMEVGDKNKAQHCISKDYQSKVDSVLLEYMDCQNGKQPHHYPDLARILSRLKFYLETGCYNKTYQPTRDCCVSLSTDISSMNHLHEGRTHTVYPCAVCNDVFLSQQSLTSHQLQQLTSALSDHNYYVQTQLNLDRNVMSQSYMKQESEFDLSIDAGDENNAQFCVSKDYQSTAYSFLPVDMDYHRESQSELCLDLNSHFDSQFVTCLETECCNKSESVINIGYSSNIVYGSASHLSNGNITCLTDESQTVIQKTCTDLQLNRTASQQLHGDMLCDNTAIKCKDYTDLQQSHDKADSQQSHDKADSWQFHDKADSQQSYYDTDSQQFLYTNSKQSYDDTDSELLRGKLSCHTADIASSANLCTGNQPAEKDEETQGSNTNNIIDIPVHEISLMEEITLPKEVLLWEGKVVTTEGKQFKIKKCQPVQTPGDMQTGTACTMCGEADNLLIWVNMPVCQTCTSIYVRHVAYTFRESVDFICDKDGK